jgi:DNA-binding NtrC family response regulator
MKAKSILLVDDESLILCSLSRELANIDRKVTVAASGEKAIAKINHNHFDLVITDLLLPGLDGFQVLKATKRKNAQTMVIIMTGHADLAAAVDALRLGADDFLQKPCDTGELLWRIFNCFAKQELYSKASPHSNTLMTCCYCRKIRDAQQEGFGQERWYSIEEYFNKVKGVKVSHGCCPDCFPEQMKNFDADNSSKSGKFSGND